MMAVEYSDDAKRDVMGIWAYTAAKWSKAQADKYLALLRAGCEKLARNPNLGRKYSGVTVRYLCYRRGQHVIVYRVLASGVVFIVRILHGSMDLANWIEDEI